MSAASPVAVAMDGNCEVWCADFEFVARDGDKPDPVCMVAKELHSQRETRLWRDDLVCLSRAPFDTGPDAVFCAYFASAELSCFLALGWPLPERVVDLYVEHRVETNGLALPGNSLLDAASVRGLATMAAVEKDLMRDRILAGGPWNEAERRSILDYCAEDVALTERLLRAMALAIDWPRAFLRGRYMRAVARMEATGVPIDVATHRHFVAHWDRVKLDLVGAIDADYGVYDGSSFRTAKFAYYLARNRIPWPRLPSGVLALDSDSFKDQARVYPALYPLHELRSTLAGLRLTGLTIGRDGRNRALLSPFRSITGRNQPSNTKFIFGPATWMRSLIQPPEGYSLCYVDWSAQEVAVAAALSGDPRMIDGYLSGDPYISFARDAGLAPPDATKASHPSLREVCKVVVLAIGYGMEAPGLAARLGIPTAEAMELLHRHRHAYQTFWRWLNNHVSAAMLSNVAHSAFGWRMRVTRATRYRTVQNFPAQANGAEMMRLAAIGATEAGIEVCAPIHDAFLIAAPTVEMDGAIDRMSLLMRQAGQAVIGMPVRTDFRRIDWPDRYSDPRGARLWQKLSDLTEGYRGLPGL